MSDEFKWEPWHQETVTQENILLRDITEPPCKHCKNWLPHVNVTKDGKLQGVTCCIAEKMYSDFLCFEQPYKSKALK